MFKEKKTPNQGTVLASKSLPLLTHWKASLKAPASLARRNEWKQWAAWRGGLDSNGPQLTAQRWPLLSDSGRGESHRPRTWRCNGCIHRGKKCTPMAGHCMKLRMSGNSTAWIFLGHTHIRTLITLSLSNGCSVSSGPSISVQSCWKSSLCTQDSFLVWKLK